MKNGSKSGNWAHVRPARATIINMDHSDPGQYSEEEEEELVDEFVDTDGPCVYLNYFLMRKLLIL
jgi:hypothetical protein